MKKLGASKIFYFLFLFFKIARLKLLTRNMEFGKHLYISLKESHVVDYIKCLNLQLNLNGRKSLLYFQTLWVISGYTQKARLDGSNTLYSNSLLLFSNTGLNVCQMPPAYTTSTAARHNIHILVAYCDLNLDLLRFRSV